VPVRSHPTILTSRNESYDLPCAACGEIAVTFQLCEDGVQANSISNVNGTTRWNGETGQRLAELLAAGSARAVLDFFAAQGPFSCPSYCPECDGVYCRKHYSVEEEWSGTWYTAGHATCPRGHKREFE
jgi:hypothetical protein